MTRASRDAAARGAEVVVFPELSLTGYPPRDLVEKPAFLESCERELDRLARETADLGLSVICGYVGRSRSRNRQARAQQRRRCIERGEIVFRQSKMLLPNYDVFDEARYFRPAEREYLCTLRGQSGRAHHLRRRLERQALLGATPLPARSGGRTVRSRRARC